MNRRSFIKKLASFVAGCAVAVHSKLELKEELDSFQKIQHHQFESKTFYFMPSFTDFLNAQKNDS